MGHICYAPSPVVDRDTVAVLALLLAAFVGGCFVAAGVG
jgi:hypothetical protein